MFEVKIILGENSYPLKISSKIVSDAQDYFNKLDADMNKGWKMSKSWVCLLYTSDAADEV